VGGPGRRQRVRTDDDIAYSDRVRPFLDDDRHHTLALNIYSPSTTDWRRQVSVSHNIAAYGNFLLLLLLLYTGTPV